MIYRVEFTAPASRQADSIATWWRENRPGALDAFEDDLTHAISLLAARPPPTRVYADLAGKPVRKARLPRTGYALYFTVDGDIVTVHAVWHGTRGSNPPL